MRYLGAVAKKTNSLMLKNICETEMISRALIKIIQKIIFLLVFQPIEDVKNKY
jgi:hypothetical protein